MLNYQRVYVQITLWFPHDFHRGTTSQVTTSYPTVAPQWPMRSWGPQILPASAWFSAALNELQWICLPGLVNVKKKRWNITMLLMGKSTISMVIFNSKLFVYQMVKWEMATTINYFKKESTGIHDSYHSISGIIGGSCLFTNHPTLGVFENRGMYLTKLCMYKQL